MGFLQLVLCDPYFLDWDVINFSCLEYEAMPIISSCHEHLMCTSQLKLFDFIDSWIRMPFDRFDDWSIPRVNQCDISKCRCSDQAISIHLWEQQFRESAKLTTNLHCQSLSEVCQIVDIDLAVDSCRASYWLGFWYYDRFTRVLMGANNAVNFACHILWDIDSSFLISW